jgi:threonine/homoserine/homoserine lactone efflux protein
MTGAFDMEGHLFMTYLVAITLLTVTPGVDTLLVIRNSARGGWRDGAVSSLGICSGLFVHGAVSAVGISVIVLQTAWLYSLLKMAGAAYLVWLGIGNWRSALQHKPLLAVELPAEVPDIRMSRSLREGFLSNVLNPKTAVFYMAFLPQFIDPAGSAFLQSLSLAGLHFLIAMLWQSLLALLVEQAQARLARPAVNSVFNGVTGTVMVALGIKLASERAV